MICRKYKFKTRADAKTARKRLYGNRKSTKDGPLSIYICPACDFFHLGHMPAEVRNGVLDKDAYIEGLGYVRD